MEVINAIASNMNELQAIIEAFTETRNNGKMAALATVVKVQGSAYRRPGARMLITEDGHKIGAISGGCLEDDVCDIAQEVIATGKPTVVTYDTTSDDDIFWGLGMGCNGIIQVLIEPIESQFLTFINNCLRQRSVGAIATVFHTSDDIATKIGSRICGDRTGIVINQIADKFLEQRVIEDIQAALKNERSPMQSYEWDNQKAEVLIEVIKPPISLLVFGAGDDAIPVVRLAKELGWYVTVIDRRLAYATSNRFPLADAIVISSGENIGEYLTLDCYTVAVVMTHNYLCDRDILPTLLSSPLPYIGILGSRKRIEKLFHDLQQANLVLNSEQLERLYAPIGLDLGAETPTEIALAIIAEIKAVLAKRSGGCLRNRKAPIHDVRSNGSGKQYDRPNKIGSFGFMGKNVR
ncbi:XdhC family protein [Aerosakkonema sp. BLCC-F183]